MWYNWYMLPFVLNFNDFLYYIALFFFIRNVSNECTVNFDNHINVRGIWIYSEMIKWQLTIEQNKFLYGHHVLSIYTTNVLQNCNISHTKMCNLLYLIFSYDLAFWIIHILMIADDDSKLNKTDSWTTFL